MVVVCRAKMMKIVSISRFKSLPRLLISCFLASSFKYCISTELYFTFLALFHSSIQHEIAPGTSLHQYNTLPTSTSSTAASTYVKIYSTVIAVSKHMLGSVMMKSGIYLKRGVGGGIIMFLLCCTITPFKSCQLR